MKKQTMFFSFLFAASFMHAGILFDTLVQTPDGLKEIQTLGVGDQVISVDKDFLKSPKPITSIEEKELDSYVEIIMDNDEVLRVSIDQRFFIPCKWVQADQLSLGDVLLKNDTTFARIKSICVKQERIMIRFITVQDYENFFASQNGVLIHNGAIGAAVGVTVGASAVAATYAGITTGIGVVSGPAAPYVLAVWGLWTAGPALVAIKVGGLVGGLIVGTATGPI